MMELTLGGAAVLKSMSTLFVLVRGPVTKIPALATGSRAALDFTMAMMAPCAFACMWPIARDLVLQGHQIAINHLVLIYQQLQLLRGHHRLPGRRGWHALTR